MPHGKAENHYLHPTFETYIVRVCPIWQAQKMVFSTGAKHGWGILFGGITTRQQTYLPTPT